MKQREKEIIVFFLCLAVLCAGLFSQPVFSAPVFENVLRDTSNSYFQSFDGCYERANQCTIESIREHRSFSIQKLFRKDTSLKTERHIQIGFVALFLFLLFFGRIVLERVKEEQDILLPMSVVFYLHKADGKKRI